MMGMNDLLPLDIDTKYAVVYVVNMRPKVIDTNLNTLTIRLPDDLADRLKSTAQARGISVNKLIAEISLQALTSFDAETRFKALAAGADIPSARRVLERLGKHH
jgi:plasmid stability protein